MGTRSEQDFLNLLRLRCLHDGEASLEVLGIADEAVAAFPSSTKLWCMRAALIQLGSGNAPYTLDEALVCYQRALATDPSSVEALEDIAHFYDAVLPGQRRIRRLNSSRSIYMAERKYAPLAIRSRTTRKRNVGWADEGSPTSGAERWASFVSPSYGPELVTVY